MYWVLSVPENTIAKQHLLSSVIYLATNQCHIGKLMRSSHAGVWGQGTLKPEGHVTSIVVGIVPTCVVLGQVLVLVLLLLLAEPSAAGLLLLLGLLHGDAGYTPRWGEREERHGCLGLC